MSAALAGVEAVNPLLLRVLTGLVLVAVALAAVWVGGPVFTALVAAATLVMFAEWAVMHRLDRGLRLAGMGVVAGAILLTTLASPGEALVLLGGGAGLLGLFASRLRGGLGRATVIGVLYCGLPALALIWLRGRSLGLEATTFVLLCVWATDIAAYFAGRAIGGAKLAPAISPNKTWAGAIGGVIGAMIVAGGLATAYLASMAGQGAYKFWALAAVLSVLSILGDLYESWLKRRAGVKDSGRILPGHGGVLDRLDGLVPVAIAGTAVFAITGWAG